jgi:hypothetical protein
MEEDEKTYQSEEDWCNDNFVAFENEESYIR